MKKAKKLRLRKETLVLMDPAGLQGVGGAVEPGPVLPSQQLKGCTQTCDGCDTTTCSVSHLFSDCHNCGNPAQAAPDAAVGP